MKGMGSGAVGVGGRGQTGMHRGGGDTRKGVRYGSSTHTPQQAVDTACQHTVERLSRVLCSVCCTAGDYEELNMIQPVKLMSVVLQNCTGQVITS